MSTSSHPHHAFIQARVPSWLSGATAEQRERYFTLAKASAASAAQAAVLLRRLQSPEAFARERLAPALKDRFALNIDIDHTHLVRFHTHANLLERTLEVSEHTLLEAAMQNFAADEGFAAGSALLPAGSLQSELYEAGPGRIGRRWNYDRSRVLPITPTDFADCCRLLDLGGEYQRHVATALKSAGSETLLERNFTDSLAVQMQVALLKGDIDQAEHDMLHAYLQAGTAQWHGQPLRCSSLRLAVSLVRSGYVLNGPLLFDTADGKGRCVVYLPGQAGWTLKAFASRQAFADDLRERLRDPDCRAHLRRYIAVAEQPAFFHRLINTLSPKPVDLLFPEDGVADPEADIGLACDAITECLPAAYRQLWQARTAQDASALMVPVATVDSQASAERWAGYLADGLTLLNVAALFIPGLGVLMLGVGVLQVAADIFVGIDDWQHGQTEDAMAHLASVVENVALVGAAAGAGAWVSQSAFVADMIEVVDGQGQARLWSPQMSGYRADVTLAADAQVNDLGQYTLGAQRYVRLDEALYRVAQRPGTEQWEVLHPTDAGAYRPLLVEHDGAWRLQHEFAGTWQGTALMRRWGARMDPFNDAQLQAMRQVSGISEAQLRECHVNGSPMPALLADTLQRWEIDLDLEQAIAVEGAASAEVKAQRFSEIYRQRQLTVRADVALLQRDFPGLPSGLAEEMLGNASDAERQALSSRQRVPVRLAEEAQRNLRRLRLNRALESCVLKDLGSPDGERVKQALPALAQKTDHLPLVTETMREQAAEALGQRAVQPWFRAPVRDPLNRLGYPLSGRGQGRWTLEERINRLFPGLIPEELTVLHAELSLSGPLDAVVAGLEQDYRTLEASLDQWVDTPSTYTYENGTTMEVSSDSRRQAATIIRRAWRRDTPTRHTARGEPFGYRLNLSNLFLGTLPSLGVAFGHIEILVLDDMYLRSDPSAFLAHFPNLRELYMGCNQLTAIPAGVADMRSLRILEVNFNRIDGSSEAFLPLQHTHGLMVLDLEGNSIHRLPANWPAPDSLQRLNRLDLSNNSLQLEPEDWRGLTRLPALQRLDLAGNVLTLDEAGRNLLARLSRLEHLNLSYNPLALAPDVRAMTRLRALSLRHTLITQLPDGLLELMAQPSPNLASVDLSSNAITHIPPLPARLLGSAHQSDLLYFSVNNNPLDEASIYNLEGAHEEIRFNVTPTLDDAPPPAPSWLEALPDSLQAAIAQAEQDPDSRAFFAVLARCVDTADYRVSAVATQARMRAIAEAALGQLDGVDGEGLVDLRQQLFDAAQDVTDTCGDGVSLVLNRFETLIAAWRAASSAATGGEAMFGPLLRESERQLRLVLLDDISMRIARCRVRRRAVILEQVRLRQEDPSTWPPLAPYDHIRDQDLWSLPDEAEIRLLARRLLADPAGPYALDLPPQPEALYGEILSMQSVQEISAAVRAQATRTALLDWLGEQGFWRNYLERVHAQAFEHWRDLWSEVADYFEQVALAPADSPLPAAPAEPVMAELERGLPAIEWRRDGVVRLPELSEQAYLAGYDRLLALRREALAALVRSLSEPLVARHSQLP